MQKRICSSEKWELRRISSLTPNRNMLNTVLSHSQRSYSVENYFSCCLLMVERRWLVVWCVRAEWRQRWSRPPIRRLRTASSIWRHQQVQGQEINLILTALVLLSELSVSWCMTGLQELNSLAQDRRRWQLITRHWRQAVGPTVDANGRWSYGLWRRRKSYFIRKFYADAEIQQTVLKFEFLTTQ